MDPRRILVVANQTVCGDELLDVVKTRMGVGACRFTLLVPATPPHEHATWTEGEANTIARRRMDEALERFRAKGAEADGVVGDANPVRAIDDVLIAQPVRRDHPVDAAVRGVPLAQAGPPAPGRATLRAARHHRHQPASADGLTSRRPAREHLGDLGGEVLAVGPVPRPHAGAVPPARRVVGRRAAVERHRRAHRRPMTGR